jgi:dTDP-4-dehydrorhamnose 3,5-epimerase
MEIINTKLRDVKILRPKIFGDERGFFMETFRDDFFKAHVGEYSFVQENHSRSGQGVLRGLHYQIKQPQGKLVRVVVGEVFDVVVDIRKKSPDFGKWAGAVLNAENKELFWVPPGFAHGFYVMGDKAELVYKCTDYYAPEFERSILWNDPAIGIVWPLVDGKLPKLSPKDGAGVPLSQADFFL